MPKATYRIFLSSPSLDLAEHRQEVAAAIEQLGHQTIRMEAFGAQPEAPVALCKRGAAEADAVVVLVGHRYGWVPQVSEDGAGQSSISQLEFDAAQAADRPIFAYEVDPEYPWSLGRESDRLENGEDPHEVQAAVEALQGFKRKIRSKVRGTFTHADDLAKKVSRDLAAWLLRQAEADRREHEPEPDPGPAARLRVPTPRALPRRPYPVLGPYEHRELFAGREEELVHLLHQLDRRVPILGLFSTSGAGKSSLLRAGLMAHLESEGAPVAYQDHPAEPGALTSMLGQLLVGPLEIADADHRAFTSQLAEVRELSGRPPLLILDQFEDVLTLPPGHPVRARVGVFLAATVRGHGGLDEPLCRWLLAYRSEFEGRIKPWLSDVVEDARRAGRAGDRVDGVDQLPSDLSSSGRFRSIWLPPFGAGAKGNVDHEQARARFLEAIQLPLTCQGGRPRYPWRIDSSEAHLLADAFAAARERDPLAPLVPQLQVVLAHLMDLARPGALEALETGDEAAGAQPPKKAAVAAMRVPNGDAEALIDHALEQHLQRALREAFPGTSNEVRRQRAQALLALRHLATAAGRRREGLSRSGLLAALGEDGAQILRTLTGEDLRVLVARERDGALAYELSHDRLAQAVVHVFEQDPSLGGTASQEVVALYSLVNLRTEQFSTEGARGPATHLTRRQYKEIYQHQGALIQSAHHQVWWQAVEVARKQRKRSQLLAAAGLVVLFCFGTWVWFEARKSSERRQLVESGTPAEALFALAEGAKPSETWLNDALDLERLEELLDPVPVGVWQQPEVLLRALERAEPLLIAKAEQGETRELRAYGHAIWTLQRVGQQEGAHEVRTRTEGLVTRLVTALFGPPQPPPREAWVAVDGDTFSMGSIHGDSDELRVHEVSLASFEMLKYEVRVSDLPAKVQEQHNTQPDPSLPARHVNWYQAVVYAAWLGGRLPTEAEWEFACRAGTETEWSFGSTAGEIGSFAWVGESDGPGGKEPNPWGLHDMHGNVWEWVGDWYEDEYPDGPRVNPWGPESSTGNRVIRGGSFGFVAQDARSAARFWIRPSLSYLFLGFRVVRSSPAGGSDIDP